MEPFPQLHPSSLPKYDFWHLVKILIGSLYLGWSFLAGYLILSTSFHEIPINIIICGTSALLPCKLWLGLASKFKSSQPTEEKEEARRVFFGKGD